MEITQGIRRLLCAMPQPGWGGTDLAGYTESIGLRPDVTGSEHECKQAVTALYNAGLVQNPEGDAGRFELTPAGIAALETAGDAAPHSVGAVLLALQPSIAVADPAVAVTEQEG